MEKNGFELKVMHFKQQLLIFSCYQWKTRLWKNTFISAIVTIKCPRRMDTERKSEQKQKKDKSGSEERILLDFSHSKWETEFAVRSDCHLVITVPNKEWLLWLCHSTKLLKAASRRQAELGRTRITLSAEHHLYHFITYISYSSDDDSLVPLVILLFLSQGTAFSCFSGNCYTNLKPCIGHRLWRKYRTLWNPPVETNVWKLLNRHSVLFPLSWAVFPQDTHHTVKNIFQRNEWTSTNAVIKIGSFTTKVSLHFMWCFHKNNLAPSSETELTKVTWRVRTYPLWDETGISLKKMKTNQMTSALPETTRKRRVGELTLPSETISTSLTGLQMENRLRGIVKQCPHPSASSGSHIPPLWHNEFIAVRCVRLSVCFTMESWNVFVVWWIFHTYLTITMWRPGWSKLLYVWNEWNKVLFLLSTSISVSRSLLVDCRLGCWRGRL